MFFRLVLRLPAYDGVLAARVAAEGRSGGGSSYESGSGQANRAASARHAPPATAAQLGALNQQLGGQWFNHRTVPAGA